MSFLWQGLESAWELITSGDPWLWAIVWVTVKVAAVATSAAVVVGVPIGLWLGLSRFRGRGLLVAVANAGLGLPPVVVGLFLALLMFPAAPLGRFRLLFTIDAVYLAQAVLALPIVVALTCSAVNDLSAGLVAQARAFGANGLRIAALAIREAWTGIMAGVIAAVGSALSEVGAVVLVGGNIHGYDQTLASAALEEINAGHWSNGAAIGIVLLGLILIVSAVLTMLQYAGRRRVRAA